MAKRKRTTRHSAKPNADERRTTRREMVERWKASGLSQAAFCRQQGLSPKTFYGWKVGVEREGAAKQPRVAGSRGTDGRSAPSAETTQAWAPVKLVPSRDAEADTLPPGCDACDTVCLEVVLGNGRRVRVGTDVDAGLLAKVVGVLEALPS